MLICCVIVSVYNGVYVCLVVEFVCFVQFYGVLVMLCIFDDMIVDFCSVLVVMDFGIEFGDVVVFEIVVLDILDVFFDEFVEVFVLKE